MAILSTLLMFVFCGVLLLLLLPLFLLRRFRAPFRDFARRGRPGKKEGEVSVSGRDANAGEKIIGDNIGEYVDYEEVEDKKQ